MSIKKHLYKIMLIFCIIYMIKAVEERKYCDEIRKARRTMDDVKKNLLTILETINNGTRPLNPIKKLSEAELKTEYAKHIDRFYNKMSDLQDKYTQKDLNACDRLYEVKHNATEGLKGLKNMTKNLQDSLDDLIDAKFIDV